MASGGDVALAELLSLVEGSAISEADARKALQASGHNVELAICRLFSGGPEQVGVIDIDIEEEADSGVAAKGRSKGRKRKSRGVAEEQRKQTRVEKKAPIPSEPSRAGRGPSEETLCEAETECENGSASNVHSDKAVGTDLPPEVQAQLRALGLGWSCAPEGSWARFSPKMQKHPQSLLQDPPCLSLQGQSERNQEACNCIGDMHSAAKAGVQDQFALQLDSGIKVLLAPGRQDTDIGGHAAVSDRLLNSLFETLLAKVRYPPSDLEFSWRLRKLQPHERLLSHRVAPAELAGTVPARPFQLLDNSADASAEQPPHFLQHPLRPEQQRSLQWMLAQEADVEPFMVEWFRFWTTFPAGEMEADEGRRFVEGAEVKLSSNAKGPFLDVRPAGVPASPVTKEKLQGVGRIVGEGTQPSSPHSGPGRLRGNCKRVKFGSIVVDCNVQDLDFFDPGGLHPGCKVMLRPGLKAPAYGWGGVKHGTIGFFLKTEGPNVIVKWPTHEMWKGKQGEVVRADAPSGQQRPPLVLDLHVRAAYRVRGGILADKIGYGKTATTIALIDRQPAKPTPPIPEVDAGRFLPAKGTLIIVPSNLFEQWINEISKFVWDGRPLRQQMKGGWSPKDCPLKIFAMSNVSPLGRCKAGDISTADVVICSYRLLYSQIYLKRREELCSGTSLWNLPNQIRTFLAGQHGLRSGRKGAEVAQKWQDLEFPVLEMFYWKRIVFDEFHELESFESAQQNSLQFLRSHFRWGLTGTPPVENNAGAIFMSSLFRVDLPGYLQASPEVDLEPWESDKLLTETAARFLDDFVRQNTAELPHIRLEEHVVIVQHTAAERALYLGQAHEAPDFQSMRAAAFQSQETVNALERLLKLCSHFQVGGDHVASADQECERIYDQKERRLVRARNQLRRCCRVLALLQQLLPKTHKSTAWQTLEKAKELLLGESGAAEPLCQELDRELSAARSEDRETVLHTLDGHKPRSEELLQFLGPEGPKRGSLEEWSAFLHGPPLEAKALEKLLLAECTEQGQNLRELHEAATSMDFFRRTVAALGGQKPEDRSCSVCLEDNLPVQKMAITPCAHAFCISCLREAVEKFGRCSLCQRSLSLRDVQPLAAELEAAKPTKTASADGATTDAAAQPTTPEASAGASSVPLDKYGTKLASLARKLSELRKADVRAKVILFVQFDDLKRKVCSALKEFGIPCAMLQGAVGKRAGIIRDWQNNPQSDTFVLLLSLAQSASGTNLTAASHVIFLHPMLAPSAEKAVGYEMQAIGRARRHGQTRDVVHVWRFVTADTVEQAITEEHQGALWKCEQERQRQAGARAAAEAAAAQVEPDAEVALL